MSTIKPVYGLLAQAAGDAAVDPLVLVAFILQEIFQQVQHLCHLQGKVALAQAALPHLASPEAAVVVVAPPMAKHSQWATARGVTLSSAGSSVSTGD